VLARVVGAPQAERLLDGAFSDPTPPVDGWMLVREWVEPPEDQMPPDGEGVATPEAALISLESGMQAILSSPGSAAGGAQAAARSPGWLAWLVGDATPDIWVLDADSVRRGGFFPLSSPGARSRPHVAGERLVWLDLCTSPRTLLSFDLGTGVERVLARGQIALDGFALGADVVVWIDGETGALRRRELSPIGR